MVAAAAPLLLLVAAVLPFGNDDCPCIDPFPVALPAGGGADLSGVLTPNCSGMLRNSVCYEASYGTRGCRAYDAVDSDECLAESPPAWCSDKWCWVARWNCNKPHHRSAFFGGLVVANATLLDESGWNCTAGGDCGRKLGCDDGEDGAALNELAYSYETCGNIDDFTYQNGLTSSMAQIASRGKIRISIPGDEPPYIVTAVGLPNETDHVPGTAQRDGSVVRFGAHLLSNMLGLDWEEVPISDESRAFSPDSSFTACTHDVALNNTDVCVGSVWPYEYRRRLTPFTSTIQSVQLHLIVKRVRREDSFTFLGLMQRPFLPFDAGMWLSLVAVLLYTGYALYQLDASGHLDADFEDEAEEEFAEAVAKRTVDEAIAEAGSEQRQLSESAVARVKADGRADALDRLKQIKYQSDWRHIFMPTSEDDVKDMLVSMIHAVQAYLGGGDFRHEPHSIQSWIVFIGFSFLILVTTSNYTAQVTLFSVLEQNQRPISSLEQGIERNYRFCGWASMQGPIEAAYPRISGLYVGVSDGNAVWQSMDLGLCDAALLDTDAWAFALGGDNSNPDNVIDPILSPLYAGHKGGAARYHCDTKMILPTVVYTIEIAYPVRSDLQRALSWAISKARDVGEWQRIHTTAQRKYVKPDACLGDAGDTSGPPSLDFWTAAGIIIISLMMTTAGLLLNTVWRCSPAQKELRRQGMQELAKYKDEMRTRKEAKTASQARVSWKRGFSGVKSRLSRTNRASSGAAPSAAIGVVVTHVAPNDIEVVSASEPSTAETSGMAADGDDVLAFAPAHARRRRSSGGAGTRSAAATTPAVLVTAPTTATAPATSASRA